MTREEELDWLCRLRSEIYVYMPKEWLISMNNALDMAIKAIEQESKIGHWEWQTEDIYRCSECNEDIHVKEVLNVPQYEWCPMCGAKMIEPQESEDKE